jgi:hypothetical protein
MIRQELAIAALCLTTACGLGSTEPKVADPLPVVSMEAFVGTWRSVTPSLEFISLSLVSKSSEQGVLGARLTFSGVYWEGSGRIDADSLIANMTFADAAAPGAVLVAHTQNALTLQVQMAPMAGASPELPLLKLGFVRDD